MRLMKWGLGAIALFMAAGVIAFGVTSIGGRAQAQTPTPSPSGDGPCVQFDEALADELNITVERLREARKAAHDKVIDALVGDNKLTAEQAARIKSMGDDRGPCFLGRKGFGARMVGAFKDIFGAAADVLGISREDLRTRVTNGESLKDIAASKNISVDALTKGMSDEIKEELQKAVDEKRITQEQMNQMLERLTGKLDDVINRTGGFKGDRMRMGPNGPRQMAPMPAPGSNN